MEDDDMVWDASMPGAGAQRANAIAQLYFRMLGYSSLTTLVVDSLCAAFGGRGATASELSDYLGVAVERVTTAVESIPLNMRCTARDLNADGTEEKAKPYTNRINKGDATCSNSGIAFGNSRANAKQETRYYLNYKRLLPLVYAHITRMLLLLCTVPLPTCAYTERVRRGLLPSALRGENAAAAAVPLVDAHGSTHSAKEGDPAVVGTSVSRNDRREQQPVGTNPATTSLSHSPCSHLQDAPPIEKTHVALTTPRTLDSLVLNISPALQQREALHGIFCPSCRFYVSSQEFVSGLSTCPVCTRDVLRSTLEAIRDGLNARCARGESLVTLTARTARVTAETESGANAVVASPANAVSKETAAAVQPTARSESWALKTPLAQDPFLVQQALVWSYLYSTPFAYVNDSHYIVHAEDILTAAEHERRLHGKASVADQFRAVHRHAASVRVRVVSQEDVDRVKRVQNAQKIAKRAQLPPWLCHYTSAEYLLATGGSRLPGNTQASSNFATAAVGGSDAVAGSSAFSPPQLEAMKQMESTSCLSLKRERDRCHTGGAAVSDEVSASKLKRRLTLAARRITQRHMDKRGTQGRKESTTDCVDDEDEFEPIALSL